MSDPTVFNSRTTLFECTGCGITEAPPSMPCRVDVFSKACLKFAKAHRYCVHPDRLPTVALSLRQPWAWLMVRPDITDPVERAVARAKGLIKDVENRKKRWQFRGRILVHAASTMTRAEYFQVKLFAEALGVSVPARADLQLGGIIGEMTIVDRVTEHTSPWFFGPNGYVVSDTKPLPFQPCKGALGFFTPNLPAA